MLVGAVTFVLLIACANVANLLHGARHRAESARSPFARRSAARAAASSRQLLTESVVLSLVGGVLGLIFGLVGIRALLVGQHRRTAARRRRRRGWSASIGACSRSPLLIALGTGVLFGLFPALQSSRTDLTTTLKESGGRSGTGFRQNKARSILVVVEVALALILLIGSALLIRTAIALGGVDPGFDPHNVLTMRMSLTGPRFLKSEGVEQIVRDGVERLRNVPGRRGRQRHVLRAARRRLRPALHDRRPPRAGGRPPVPRRRQWMTTSPGYFDVFKIPIKRGRAFNDRDNSAAPGVVIINEAMAKQFWKDGDPLNDRLVIGRGVMREFADRNRAPDHRRRRRHARRRPEQRSAAGDVHPAGAGARRGQRAQRAAHADGLGGAHAGRAASAERAGPGAAAAGDGTAGDRTCARWTRSSRDPTSRQRFNMWLMTVFGVCALLLAAIGIYGLMAYSVEQRTQEIGIRLALGASAPQVRNMVVMQGMRLALVGVVIGLAAALRHWRGSCKRSCSA